MSAIRNSADAFHRWANSPDSAAGNCGNVSFREGILYSYRAAIGRMFTAPDGRRGALITGQTYSVTTSKHNSQAYGAVAYAFRLPEGAGLTERTTPEDARAAWSAHLEDLAADYARATRAPSRGKLRRDLSAAVDRANALCTFAGLPPFADLVDPAEVERLAAEAAARTAAAAARTLVESLKKRARWVAGEGVSVPWVREAGDLLRVNGDTVETSRGAYVPVADVARAAPLLLSLVRAGVPWTPGALPVRLGHYAVDGVDGAGTLTVGCHTFPRAEVERFAAVLAALD